MGREGGHTIQEPSKTRRKAHTQSKKGYTGRLSSGRRTHHPRRGTMKVKTLDKADTPSKKGYTGSQNP